jgi:hypothetical protein
MGTLSHQLLPLGWTIPVVPELVTLTVGKQEALHIILPKVLQKTQQVQMEIHFVFQEVVFAERAWKRHHINMACSQTPAFHMKSSWQMEA